MKLPRLWPVLGGLVLLAGCAGYQLGPVNGQRAGERSIQVVPFLNRTPEARLGDAVTTAVRKELQRDGTFHLATRPGSDVILTGALTHYERREVSLSPDDLATARDYSLGLTAQVAARERSTGRVLFDQPVTSRTLVRVGPDLPSAERQALPLLATELARRITALVAEGGW